MKLGVIGIGQAGGKITERLAHYDQEHGTNVVIDAVAINTAKADLMGLEHISEDKKLLLGTSRVKGHGVGADNKLGAEIASDSIREVDSLLDNFPVHELDAFLIICGLGGGTGSGGAPVIAQHLREIYEEPVYGLGILPASEEGGIYSLNAARSFKTMIDSVDNLILFDNDAWRDTRGSGSVGENYDRLNDLLVTRLGTIFSAGEIREGADVGETVVDASEIINTLDSSGITTIGYSAADIDNKKNQGLLDRLRPSSEEENHTEDVQSTNRITSLARKAALGGLTLPAEINHMEKALVIVAGPSDMIDRKGVERARTWVEEQTGSMEVRGGDYPKPYADQIEVAILLSGVTNSDRIKELQQIAIEAKDNIDEIESNSSQNLDDLVEDDDELESLF